MQFQAMVQARQSVYTLFQFIKIKINKYKYQSRRMPKQKLSLYLAHSDSSLMESFPTDPKGDVVLKYKSKNYKLKKNVLKKSSKFLATALANCKDFYVKQNFDELALDNVLSIIYGNRISIDRFEVPMYYEIVKCFQIQELINIIIADIPKFIHQYDIFVVLKIAQDHNNEQLFKMCIEELEKESFEQLKYHQMELFNLNFALFKLIIQFNNSSRSEKKVGISFRKINQIVWEYCQCNCLPIEKFQELKLSVFDVSALSSSEFKQIFLDYFTQKLQREKFVFSSLTSIATQQSELISKKYAKYFKQTTDAKNVENELFEQLEKNPNEFILQVQNIYLNKRIQELEKQNKKLLEELKKFLTLSCKNRVINQKMGCSMKGFQQQYIKKQKFSSENLLKIVEFSSTLQKMNEQIDAKISQIEAMYNKYSKRQQITYVSQVEDKNAAQTNNNLNFSQTLFLDGQQVQKRWNGSKMNLPTPKHKGSWCDQSGVKQAVYNGSCDMMEMKRNRFMHRITFDELPVSIKCRSFAALSEMVTEDGFKKKCFKLIYRRYNHCPFRGIKSSIYNRKQLLILIKTKTGEEIGGYITTTIHQNSNGEFEDNKAFIFNLKNNIKCPIKPSEARSAIRMGKDKLVCFASDIEISEYCLQNSSRCSWPCSYGTDESNQKGDGANWFAGASQFEIQALEIYEVEEEQMEMVV